MHHQYSKKYIHAHTLPYYLHIHLSAASKQDNIAHSNEQIKYNRLLMTLFGCVPKQLGRVSDPYRYLTNQTITPPNIILNDNHNKSLAGGEACTHTLAHSLDFNFTFKIDNHPIQTPIDAPIIKRLKTNEGDEQCLDN